MFCGECVHTQGNDIEYRAKRTGSHFVQPINGEIMLKAVQRIPFIGLFVLLLATLFILPQAEGIAAKKKSKIALKKSSRKFYSRKSVRRNSVAVQSVSYAMPRGKVEAFEMLRTHSESLTKLAGLNLDADSKLVPEYDIAMLAQKAEQTYNNRINATVSLSPESNVEQDCTLVDEPSMEEIPTLEAEDETVDIDSFKALWLSYVDEGSEQDKRETMESGIDKKEVMDAIMGWLGTRYRFGGVSKTGIDCSAFTRAVYSKAASIELPRTAQTQIEIGKRVNSVAEMQFGDLVFFHTANHAYVSHVGIYLGDNLFAHASSKLGVTISSLETPFYAQHVIAARRITKNDVANLVREQVASRD